MVKRFEPEMVENKYGDYVSLDDYTNLEDEVADLRQKVEGYVDAINDKEGEIAELESEIRCLKGELRDARCCDCGYF